MTTGRRDSRWVAGALALALLALLAQAAHHSNHFVDDAFIGFHYADNLRAAQGFVWHPGDAPVEGVTNLGWVLLLTALGGLGALPVVAKGLGLLALAATVVAASGLQRRLVPEAGLAERVALPLLLAAQPELVYFSLAGMETGLAALLTVLTMAAALRFEEHPRAGAVGLAALSTALFLLRPEMAMGVPLFVLLRATRGDAAGRKGLGWLAGATLLGLAWITLWRFQTFGSPVPNTFVAKSPGGLSALIERALAVPFGSSVNVPPPFGLGLAVVAFGASLVRRPRLPAIDLAIAWAATGYLFAIYARPDWTEMGRYFGPYVPVAMLLLVRGAAEAARRVTPRHGQLLLAGVTVTLLGHGALRHAEHLTGDALTELPGIALVSESLESPARRIAAQVPATATVACRRIGVLGFVAKARIFDFAYGLTEPEVARQLRRSGVPDFGDARTPALAEIWRRLQPDYLLEDWTRLDEWLIPGESPRHFRIHGVPYEVIATYPIGEGYERWALARRLVDEPVVSEEDWRAGAKRIGPRDPLSRP